MKFKWWPLMLAPLVSEAKIIIPISQTEVYEIPRSQIKTYVQRETIEANLRPIRSLKPSALSDEELLTVPERYLPPELKVRQKELRSKTAKVKKEKSPKLKISDTVKISIGKDKSATVKIDEAIWVSPQDAAKSEAKVLAPQRRLPEVALLNDVQIQGSERVVVEIEPGERLEILRSLSDEELKNPIKKPLEHAVHLYRQKDYASSVTLALGVMASNGSSAATQMWARYLAAHSLFQAGFYASTLPHLVELATSELRRSAIGIAAKAITLTRDDAAANQILSKVSLSQIREKDQALFAFHLGRILLNSGAGPAALASFAKIPESHVRFPEAQYYMGVIRSSEMGRVDSTDWDKVGSPVHDARLNFEQARTAARTEEAKDLKDLANLAMARLAYQSLQYNQAVFFYQQVGHTSPFLKEALFEKAWSLYRMGEFNRSLGTLHAFGSKYFVGEDVAELWVLRSLNYLKLCRFDEAKLSANVFERTQKEVAAEVVLASQTLKGAQIRRSSDMSGIKVDSWVRRLFVSDPVVQKDFSRVELLSKEKARLKVLGQNLRVKDMELKESVVEALSQQLDLRVNAIAAALSPYFKGRLEDINQEYRNQKGRLDVLRYEIYSQATRFPEALDRPEAKKQIAKGEFLPGVFLRGHEILWKFSGESLVDELTGYDYFLPTECLADKKVSSL